MALTLPGWLNEALNYAGYEWPAANEDVLNQYGDSWSGLQTTTQTHADNATTAVTHVQKHNDEDASGAFVDYMTGDEGNISSLTNFAEASGTIATGFHLIADAVVVLKGVVIAQLTILAAAIASAFFTFGLGAAAALAARELAKRLIDAAINLAVEKLLGTA